jgi:catechol 2,3-dioxygenase-like lactoylglutathione lyase family enzyme
MLHHLPFGIADLAVSAPFYDAVLGALGYSRVWSDLDSPPDHRAIGYGLPGGGDKLALKPQRPGIERPAPGPGFHLAFAAPSRDADKPQRSHDGFIWNGAKSMFNAAGFEEVARRKPPQRPVMRLRPV